MNARIATQILALIGALATLAILIYASRAAPAGTGWSRVGFVAWATLPYLVLYITSKYVPSSGRWTNILAITSLVLSAAALYGYISGILIAPDAQSGIMFVVFPAYQLVIAVAMLLTSLMLTRRTSRSRLDRPAR